MKIQNENCFCCTDYSILKLLAVITLIKSCHFFCQVIHNTRHLHFSPTCFYFGNYKWILLTPLPPPSLLRSPSQGVLLPFVLGKHRGIPCREIREGQKKNLQNYQQGRCFLPIRSRGGAGGLGSPQHCCSADTGMLVEAAQCLNQQCDSYFRKIK